MNAKALSRPLAILVAVLLLGELASAVHSGAEAKQVVDPDCGWFGTAPVCDGECPAGWTEKKRNKKGDGEKCVTGSKVYCCNFQERCVPDFDPSWRADGKRTLDDGTIQCQQCDKWGTDCAVGGPPRFNTACAHYTWVTCGHAAPKTPTQGKDIGLPIQVPDPNAPSAQPTCNPPKVTYPSGACACPRGLIGEYCDHPDVR